MITHRGGEKGRLGGWEAKGKKGRAVGRAVGMREGGSVAK